MKTTIFNKTITILTIILVIINFSFIVYHFSSLPHTISSHYNLIGNADSKASKFLIIILPTLSIATFFSFGYILKKPEIINFPIKVTKENSEKLYFIAVTIINLIRFLVISLLLFLSISIVNNEIEGIKQINIYVVYLFIILILLTLVVGIKKMYNVK